MAERLEQIKKRVEAAALKSVKSVAAEFEEDGVISYHFRLHPSVISISIGELFANAPDDLSYLIEGFEKQAAEVERLKKALEGVVESAVNDSDCCPICCMEVTKHSAGCSIERAEAALSASQEAK